MSISDLEDIIKLIENDETTGNIQSHLRAAIITQCYKQMLNMKINTAEILLDLIINWRRLNDISHAEPVIQPKRSILASTLARLCSPKQYLNPYCK